MPSLAVQIDRWLESGAPDDNMSPGERAPEYRKLLASIRSQLDDLCAVTADNPSASAMAEYMTVCAAVDKIEVILATLDTMVQETERLAKLDAEDPS